MDGRVLHSKPLHIFIKHIFSVPMLLLAFSKVESHYSEIYEEMMDIIVPAIRCCTQKTPIRAPWWGPPKYKYRGGIDRMRTVHLLTGLHVI